MKKLNIILSSATLALALVSHASATTITIGGTSVAGEGQQTSVSGATTMTFDGLTALPSGFVAIGTNPSIPLANSPDNPGVYAAPTGDTSTYLTTGVGVILDFAIPQSSNYFGLYWGSIDPGNTLELDSSDGSVLDLTGQQLAAMFPATITANGSESAYVNIWANPGAYFTSAGFSSTTYSFEFDNVATATPEPASIAMLAGGLVVVAGALRRRKV